MFELYPRQRLHQYIIIYIFSMWILNYHHLYLQYVNTEISSIYLVWEYWNHHHLYLQYWNTETSSISSVWEYWNHHHLYIQYRNTERIIISIFSIEIWNHHHLHLQYVNTKTSSSASYLVCRNTGLCVTMEHRVLCHHSSGYHIESL